MINNMMGDTMVEALLESLKQAGEIRNGRRPAARHIVVDKQSADANNSKRGFAAKAGKSSPGED